MLLINDIVVLSYTSNTEYRIMNTTLYYLKLYSCWRAHHSKK